MNLGPKKILIDECAREDPLVDRLMGSVNGAKPVVASADEIARTTSSLSPSEKRDNLILSRSRGCYLKQCQGMVEPYLCCRLHVLNTVVGCPLDCSYCFLQSYLGGEATTVYADTERMQAEIRGLSKSASDRLFRITTGELSDSLVFDDALGIGSGLVEFVRSIPNVVLELKTKTAAVGHLLGLDHGGKTIISWSLNPDPIIVREEPRSARLAQRLAAAQKVARAGYLLAFHFDPILHYPGWEDDYRQAIGQLFGAVDSARIAWISLGTLRFKPGTQEALPARHPRSALPTAEMIKAFDGKIRYVNPIRSDLYTKMLSFIQTAGGADTFVYLCMESKRMWERVLGQTADSPAKLDYEIAKSLVSRFPELLPRAPRFEDYHDEL